MGTNPSVAPAPSGGDPADERLSSYRVPLGLVERFYADVWNRGDHAARELFAEALVFRGSLGSQHRGVDAFLAYVDEVRGALADYQCVIEETVCEGDRLFARMRFRGRHVGPLEGFAPTGRVVEWPGAALFRCEAGRIASLWVVGDRHHLREQLSGGASS